MSCWKLIAKELHAAGRQIRTAEFMTATQAGIHDAQRLGVIVRAELHAAHGGAAAVWTLTELGRDWCTGRAARTRVGSGAYYWAATWLRALPVGMKVRFCAMCDNGDGECAFPYYGVAPHTHETSDGNAVTHPRDWIGSTRILPREQWPENFEEDPDPEQHDCGTYTHCLKCKASNVGARK